MVVSGSGNMRPADFAVCRSYMNCTKRQRCIYRLRWEDNISSKVDMVQIIRTNLNASTICIPRALRSLLG